MKDWKDQLYEKTKNQPLPKSWGGKRENSGPKPKYKEPTKTITFRIPISKEEEIRRVIQDQLKKYSK